MSLQRTHKRRAPRGASTHPLYRIWSGMLARCENANNPNHKNYGARGIGVCERWHSFEAFVADVGLRPSAAHSLERADNDGNYTPKNCRWATHSEQARNKRPRSRCAGCGDRFKSSRERQNFCSDECRVKAFNGLTGSLLAAEREACS